MELIPKDKITDDILQNCGTYNNKNECVGVHHYNVKTYICDLLPMFNLKGTMYLYDNGVFIPDFSGTELKNLITQFIPNASLIKSGTIRQIYDLFFMDAELTVTPEDLNAYPRHWIAFNDYLYDCETNILHEYEPRYRCVNRIPWNYMKVCTATSGEHVDAFLNDSMGADDKESILEYIGYSMSVNSSFQKMILLKGAGGTGKSTLLSIIQRIVGTANVSNVPLQKLEEKFHAILVMNKLMNVCADLSSLPMKLTNTTKMIVGEDTITDSYKGKDNVTFRAYCKMIFSCNALPLVLDADTTNAFFRRLIIVEMNHQPKELNRRLLDELTDEIPYLINISVKAYKRALQAQELHESARSAELLAELRKDSDSLAAFIDDMCEKDATKRVKCTDLYKEYTEYCQNEDRTALLKHTFNRQMKMKNYQMYKYNGAQCWRGLALKEWRETDADAIPFKNAALTGTEYGV